MTIYRTTTPMDTPDDDTPGVITFHRTHGAPPIVAYGVPYSEFMSAVDSTYEEVDGARGTFNLGDRLVAVFPGHLAGVEWEPSVSLEAGDTTHDPDLLDTHAPMGTVIDDGYNHRYVRRAYGWVDTHTEPVTEVNRKASYLFGPFTIVSWGPQDMDPEADQ